MAKESRGYTTKHKPYTLVITSQMQRPKSGSWATISEVRHRFNSEMSLTKYLAKEVIYSHTWIRTTFGQAVRRKDSGRVVLWVFKQDSNDLWRTEIDIWPLVERAKIIASNK